MTAYPPQKLVNIQALRGLAALLVVLSHLPVMELKHTGENYIPAFFHLGITGVDLFFVISGFIMIYITRDVDTGVRIVGRFLFSRFTRIYPLYWVVAASVYGVWSIYPTLISFDPEQTSLWRSFLLWPDVTLPLVKIGWTLIHELYFYCVFALILFFSARWRWPLLWGWVLCVIIGNQLGMGNSTPEGQLVFHPLSIEFFLGAVAGWTFLRFKQAWAMPSLVLGILTLILTWSLYGPGMEATDAGTFPHNWERVLFFGVPSAFIVYGVAAIEGRWSFSQLWVNIGNWSYSIYLTHIIVLSLIGYAFRSFARPGMLDNIVLCVLMLVGSVIGGFMAWRLIEKPALSISQSLRRKWFDRSAPTRNENA